MGICALETKSDVNYQLEIQEINYQSTSNGKVHEVQNQLTLDENQAALKIQNSFRVKQAKQEAEEKRNELLLDSPKDWVEYNQKFITPELPKQFKEQVKKSLTKEDRLLNPMQASDGSIYSGQWSRGMQNGYGQMMKSDRTYFEGTWAQGQFLMGGILFSNGDFFVSKQIDFQYQIGTATNGEKVFKNGITYDGEVQYGIPHGKGQEKHENEIIYVGNYLDGKKHGQGSLHYQDGSSYEGEHQHGLVTGKGTFRYSDGTYYSGQLLNGVMHGKGILIETDGTIYEGGFEDGKKEGRGILKFPDNSQFEGQFRMGKRHGKGKIIKKGGYVQDYEFKNGEQIYPK
ncbi:unnamed protein product (macronuclear) [Paramecium tetraurelia]|uniref:MORN repeat protein n=1 Tax=Paramecium tetraurelia TaxID=5888 RepID=A0BNS5_PARTE|nr:uncharacterized protein GSPATT00030831001 [Paramecium tetraurelia]CAK60192.1 unnamed protein product [Paramecium tetraurelia]|eukprot:XP_001427590.1 hypothetical protein (macronuclear) [Paramecium tetraurelia strain d4-2]